VRTLLALTSLGAAAAAMNPAYTSDKFRFYLDDLAPSLVLSSSSEAGSARTVGSGLRFVDLDGSWRRTPSRCSRTSRRWW